MRSKMWLMFWLVIVTLVQRILTYTSPNLYCADLNPQHSIIIDELMGTWFAVEIISHNPGDDYYVQRVLTCPVIHLSEDRTNTDNPLYRNYNYDQNYGKDYHYNTGGYNSNYNTGGYNNYNSRDYNNYNTRDYNNYNTRADNNYNNRNNYNNYRTSQGRSYYTTPSYNRQSTYRGNTWGSTEGYYNTKYPNNYNQNYDPYRSSSSSSSWYSSTTPDTLDLSRFLGTSYYGRRQQEDWRYLRLWWDEDNDSSTEYQLRYNFTRPGFLFSSGPTNRESSRGSSLAPQFSHFVGTIQVMKAVSDHVVLTFCSSMPERQLFTVILSSEKYMNYADLDGVHRMLNRKELRTDNIVKTCGGAGKVEIGILSFIALVVAMLVI